MGLDSPAGGLMTSNLSGDPSPSDEHRQAEQHYRELYERTPAMLHSIDAEGRLVSVSAAWLKRLGYTRDEVLGRKSVEFLTSQSARYARDVILPAYYESGRCVDVPYQFITKNGEIVEVLLSAEAERDADGKFVRSTAALTDVTERNHLASSLERAKRMEMIGQLGGGVAHDLNNILLVIRAECTFARDASTSDAVKADLETALTAVKSGERLVRQLLTIAGRHVGAPERVDVEGALLVAARHFKHLVPTSVEFETELHAPGASIHIDPGQLEQALLNLLLNARDAVGDSGSVVLSALVAGDSVVVSVRDTGVGMSAAALQRAVEPLFTTKAYGTGLGLATTKRIVEQVGGQLGIQSREGEGTTVEMTFPALASST